MTTGSTVASLRPSSSRPIEPPTPARAPVLDVHDLTVAYHRKPVLWDVDLTSTAPGWSASSARTAPARAR